MSQAAETISKIADLIKDYWNVEHLILESDSYRFHKQRNQKSIIELD